MSWLPLSTIHNNTIHVLHYMILKFLYIYIYKMKQKINNYSSFSIHTCHFSYKPWLIDQLEVDCDLERPLFIKSWVRIFKCHFGKSFNWLSPSTQKLVSVVGMADQKKKKDRTVSNYIYIRYLNLHNCYIYSVPKKHILIRMTLAWLAIFGK